MSASFLNGGGEMGVLIRALDWRATPLGAPDAWAQPLKTAVGILLNSGYPMYIAWGESFTQIYNDAYLPILGSTKHPAALGIGTPETFPEIWDYIGPMFHSVMNTGVASTFNDQLLPLNRHGFVEECYFVFSYSPVLTEHGSVGGVFVTVLETTERVLRDRRQKILRELMALPAQGSREQIFTAAADILASNKEDFCFLRIYVDEANDPIVMRAGNIDHEAIEAAITPAVYAGLRKAAEPVDLGSAAILGPWPEPVKRAVRLPIAVPGAKTPAGTLEVGLSPRLDWDNTYRDFLTSVAGSLGAKIAEAEAFEHERRRAQALAEIDAAKTVFFSNVSHEFRTPLTLMLAPIEELLGRPELLDQDARALLLVANRNALRLLRMVNALLDFSRIEAGRISARYEATDLSALTADLASNFRSAIEGAGLKFIVDCPPLDKPVHVDPDMWEKIVLNLISNAFKYTFSGHIAVRLGPAGEERVALSIEDTGAGIPDAALSKLFERFYRVEGARGRSHEGTGIGLALVQELVRLHGGEVQVRSVEGAGSTFTVTIPKNSKHLLQIPAPHQAPQQDTSMRARVFVQEALHWQDHSPLEVATELAPAGKELTGRPRGRRVLVADDNADMRAYVQRLLQGQGYDVMAVADGEAALRAALVNAPDLILSDIMMPGLDGFGLLRELRRRSDTRGIPVILVSARAGEEARIEGLRAGADDYVVKPFSARELYARVASAIQLAELRSEVANAARIESLRVRALFEQAPGFITILAGPDHVFEFANASYRRLVGNRALIGKPVREALSELEGQGYFELLDKVYATGERFVGREARLRLQAAGTSGPREVSLDFIYEPIKSADGSVSGIFVEGYEVTERVEAQAALGASEEQLRLATEAAEISLWDVDNRNDTLYWPPRLKAMFGIAPDAPVTMDDFYAGLHPEDRGATAAAYKAANDPERRALYDVEYRTIGKKDGVIRWVAAKVRGVFDDQGRCIRVIGTAIDITGRKAKEARLKELNEILERRMSEALAEKKLLADIVDGTDIFVQVADHDYNWLAINKAASEEFARIFGVRPPVAGDNMLAMLHAQPEHQAAVKQVWARALAGEEFVEVDAFGDTSLHRRYYEMKFRTLRDGKGRAIGAYQFVSDVTERLQEQNRLREAEAALAQAQKMEAVGQLTGGIAHDFNNLLGAVVGSFDLIRRRPADVERVLRYAEGGLRAAERGAKLTAQLLAFSRAQRMEMKPVIVSDLVQGMRDLLDRTLGPMVRLNVDLHAGGTVLSDATQLEMAILNLAINARDAMPDGGELIIRTRPCQIHSDPELEPGEYVELAVIDTGSGMPPEVATRAFDPFFTTKGIGKGTGLGLSQVYGIARQAGGTVRIESQPGAGTTVRLYLRKTQTAGQMSEQKEIEAEQPAGSANVLIIDDDPDLRRVLAASLEALGYAVVEAADGPTGLAVFDRTAPDLIIVDFAMPDMNGAEVAKAARERRPDLPIVFASGYAETEKIEHVGSDAPLLRKPFRLSELQAVLADALRRPL